MGETLPSPKKFGSRKGWRNYLDVKSTSSSEFGKLRRDDVPTQPVYTPSPEELRQTGDTSRNSPILSLRRSVSVQLEQSILGLEYMRCEMSNTGTEW
jgi:hypothetical protein